MKPNQDDPFLPIEYKHESFPEDKELIKLSIKSYCRKIMTKMAFYVATIYGYEILKMWGEFLVDDFGQVWFINALDIKVRTKSGYEEITNWYGTQICWKVTDVKS